MYSHALCTGIYSSCLIVVFLPLVFEQCVKDQASQSKYKAKYSKQTVDHCESHMCVIYSINWATIIGYIST